MYKRQIYGCEIFSLELLPKKYIIYQFEQLWAKVGCSSHLNKEDQCKIFHNFINIIQKSMCVWEYSKPNIRFWRERGVTVPIYHVPLGYVPSMEYGDCDIYQNIHPVGFIGCIPNMEKLNRRKNILSSMESNNLVQIYNNNIWNNDDNRIGELCHTKGDVIKSIDIGLIIYMYPTVVSSFDLYRVLLFIANKCLVISEYSLDLEMDDLFSNYVEMGEYYTFEEKIKYYIANPKDRNNVINRAYEWLINNFKYSDFIPKDILQ